MYQALVRGSGKHVRADSLKQLVHRLSRENIRVGENELVSHQKRLDAGFPVEIIAVRKLTRSELIRKSMHPPYLGNPFRRVPDTERVSLRITHINNQKRKDDEIHV